MKIPLPLLVAVCLPALAGPALAQDVPAPPRRMVLPGSVPAAVLPPATPPPVADADKLTRFDLDFPGGTPAELAAAISKAIGRHLNLVIPAERAATKIMPIKVDGVTVPYLFAAITRASQQKILLRSRTNSEYRDVAIFFLSESPLSDDTVWSFSSTSPTPEEMAFFAELQRPESVCRYFQLSPYLEDYSIEDITTAIQTGWRMAKVEPMPQLSFHRETKLLIAVGPERSVQQIPDVLNALPQDRGPALERIVKLQAELDEAIAKNDETKAEELRRKIRQIAARQKANDEINNGGRRTIRPAPVPLPAN